MPRLMISRPCAASWVARASTANAFSSPMRSKAATVRSMISAPACPSPVAGHLSPIVRQRQSTYLHAARDDVRETVMAKGNGSHGPQQRRLRSQLWFDNPDNPGMTALYLERYLNYGLTRAELTSGKPIIGIAQTGSDLSPCNRHHLELAKRVRA